MIKKTTCPFIDFVREDKSKYPKSSSKGYTDLDDDFLIGDSGGILMNWNFLVVNTYKFSLAAAAFGKDGPYTTLDKESRAYNVWWNDEKKKRKEGATENCKLLFEDKEAYYAAATDEERESYLKPLRISGDHYNYLNYGRIKRTATEKERDAFIKAGRRKIGLIPGFPRYWDGDYWNFKFDEFIALNNFNLVKSKARRKGYSFKRGSQAANTMNLYKGVKIMLGAYLLDYLIKPGKTTTMVKSNLDWFETQTNWKKGYISEKMTAIKLGYKLSHTGNIEYGSLSSLNSVSFKGNSSAAIGEGILELDLEEAGALPNIVEVINVTSSTTEVGDEKVGTIRMYGTAGTKEANWIDFAKFFYNPESMDALPIENIWDENSRANTCGFFHPQILNYEPYMDEDGNSLLDEAFAADYEKKEKKRLNSTTSAYLSYVGQRANSPEEAFLSGSENMYSSHELNTHILNLTHNKALHFWRDGVFYQTNEGVNFKTNNTLISEGNKKEVHPYIDNVPIREDDDPYGCVRIFYSPEMFKINGEIPDDLLYSTADPVGKDKSIEDFEVRNSLNCFTVFAYPNNFGIPSDVPVASYVGRPSDASDANRIGLLMCKAYNAKLLAEIDRGKIVADFRRWGALKYLLRDPSNIIGKKTKNSESTTYGLYIGEGTNKEDGLIYLKEYLYEPISADESGNTIYRIQYINDLPFLKELQAFKTDGNYDRISTYILAMFQRLAYRTAKKQASERKRESIFERIGLYRQ